MPMYFTNNLPKTTITNNDILVSAVLAEELCPHLCLVDNSTLIDCIS